MKNFTERRKDGPKVRVSFENFPDGAAAKSSRRVALLPREEGFCPAFGSRGSRPELFVYIGRPFRFRLGRYGSTFAHVAQLYAAELSPFFGDEWNLASKRSSIQPRVPFFSGLMKVRQSRL